MPKGYFQGIKTQKWNHFAIITTSSACLFLLLTTQWPHILPRPPSWLNLFPRISARFGSPIANHPPLASWWSAILAYIVDGTPYLICRWTAAEASATEPGRRSWELFGFQVPICGNWFTIRPSKWQYQYPYPWIRWRRQFGRLISKLWFMLGSQVMTKRFFWGSRMVEPNSNYLRSLISHSGMWEQIVIANP